MHLLRYVENSTDEVAEENADEVVRCIHERVQYIKRDRELEVGYMRLEELLQDREEEGIAKGMAEGIEKGIAKGKCEAILEFLSELGEVPSELQMRIKEESDLAVLSGWVKLAARSNSMEEFRTQM